MTEKDSKNYFKQLTTKEKLSKIHQVAKAKGEVIFWEKGKTARFPLQINYFDKNDFKLYLNKKETGLIGRPVLYSFKLVGLNFFGQGVLDVKGNEVVLDVKGELFKTERRVNFRLLTYPAHQVFVNLALKGFAQQSSKDSNVIQFTTGLSQTGLFNSFLDMIGDDSSKNVTQGLVPFRVQDISVTGLSIMIGEVEREFFTKGMHTGKLLVDFEKKPVEVLDAEIVYVVEAIAPGHGGKAYKVGIHFLKMTDGIDQTLAAHISSLIRFNDDEEFEDFIK